MKKRSFIRRSLAWLCALTMCAGTAGSLESGRINTDVQAADAILHSADFEGSTDGWTSFGSSSVASSTAASHNGSASLFVSGRTDSWNGTACDMSSVMEAGETYQFDTWAMQNVSASETIQLMAKYTDGSGDQYVSIAEASAAKGTWVQLAGTLKLPSDASGVLIYFQTSGTMSNFYVDDVKVTGAASWSTSALDETPLKDIYANYFKIGCAATAAELSTVISQDVVKHHFNSLTVGNELKPDYVLDKAATQSSGSNVNPVVSLEQASSVLKFCEDNQIPVRGHVLVWHSQTPEWFFRENFSDTGAFVSKEIMSQRMENYIKNVMNAMKTQYPDLDIYCWDVVNECYMEDGSLRAAGTDAANGQSMWTKIYGDNSYIEQAFTYARKYAPEGCKLFYNDYNEYIEGKRDAIYKLASDLKSKGLIDGIGMQSHLDTDYPSVDLYKQALAKFAQLGLEIQVTELDITEYDQSASNIQKQNQMYGDIMQAIVDAKKNGANITAAVFWGITDGTSWRKDGCPLLLDADYAPKQTFYEVAGLIDESEWGDGSAKTPSTPVFVKGDVDSDNDADAGDVKALQEYLLAKTTTLPNAAAGDLTADGVLNGFDLAILKRMVGGGSGTDDVPALENCKLIVPVESTATIDVGTSQEVETLTLQMDTTRDYILHVNVGFWSAWCNIECKDGVLTQVDTEQNIASLSISGNTVTITFNDSVYASVDESKSSQQPYAGKITLHHNSGNHDIGVVDYHTALGAEYVPPTESDTLVDMSELEGWAATAGYGRSGVTGGGNATPVYVDTLEEITAAVSGNEPKVVVVDGTITCGSSGIEVGSNTTIVGKDKNAAIKGAFYMKSVQNIIISNITLHGFYPDSGPDDCISARNVQHLWLNHLTLHDAGDGLMDITVGSDLVTVSWCKFYYTDLSNDHRLCCLNSSGTGHDEDIGKVNVTYHHNWFAEGVDQRMPRILYGKGHVYNNYYTASGNLYCVGVGSYASVLIEGNYFKSVNRPHQFMYTHALPCYITARDNVYDNTSGAQDTGLGGGDFGNVEPFTNPPYSYTIDNAKDIPSIVSANAGPQ